MTLRRHTPLALGLALLAAPALAASADAQLAVSGNDNKVINVNGVVTVVPNPAARHGIGDRPQGIAAARGGRGPGAGERGRARRSASR